MADEEIKLRKSMLAELFQHVDNAKQKHPIAFTDLYNFDDGMKKDLKKLLTMSRRLNDYNEVYSEASFCEVLQEEVTELQLACMDGDVDEVVKEAYDVMAVLWRLVEQLSTTGLPCVERVGE